jgi:hypothetical protein
MIRNPCHTRSCDESHQEPDLAYRPAQRTTSSPWPVATTLRSICDALREGLAAHRHYEHLKSRGISHDTALREALGIRIPASGLRTATSRDQYRSLSLRGTDQSDEAFMRCEEGFAGTADPAPRLRASARIANLAYVK